MNNISQKAFGRYIKSCRENKNMTRQELADKLYVSADAVAKWERGIRYPDFEMVKGLADVLGVSVQDIYDNSEKNEKINNILISVLIIFVIVGGCILGTTIRGSRGSRGEGNVGTQHSEEETTTENEETTAEKMALETNEAGYEMRKWDYDENGEVEDGGANCLTLFKIDGVVYSGLMLEGDIDRVFGVSEIGAMSMIDPSLVPKYDMEFAVGPTDWSNINCYNFKDGDIVYWGYIINPENQKEKVVAKKNVSYYGEEYWEYFVGVREYTQ